MAAPYRILLSRRADKVLGELARTQPQACTAIEDALAAMAEDWTLGDVKKLRGRQGYRRRVRNYRLLFRVDTEQGVILIDDIALHHRGY
ncbi:MAG: type II toxin-antitoxin system RelE/ParE family toxin [Truepera sp.]|nr:type II toxin-antitoxin system RelE/ParE family toxin [Truepera sp.]